MNDNLQHIALEACAKACTKILKIRKEGYTIATKPDQSPVTLADEAAHDIIMKELRTTQIPVLSEEGTQIPFFRRKNWSKLWIVDPLDGTKEFIQDRPEYSVNIALVENQRTIWGCIGIPEQGKIYFGGVGRGAGLAHYPNFTQNQPEIIEPIVRKKHNNGFGVAVSRSHLSDQTRRFVADLSAPDVQLMPIGSSLKFCLLATGEAQIYPRFSPCMEWDTAAGHAIIKGVGLNLYMADTDEEMRYNRENLLNGDFVAR